MSFRAPHFSRSASTTQWKSDAQKLQVLGRLAGAGIDVNEHTPASEAWKLLTDLLLDECAGRRPAKSPATPITSTPMTDWTSWNTDE